MSNPYKPPESDRRNKKYKIPIIDWEGVLLLICIYGFVVLGVCIANLFSIQGFWWWIFGSL